MTNLSWFQARDLAKGERRAIRRAGWKKWLLYRFRLWLISVTDPETNLEIRRVATANDFRAEEFLAKDWTDELFEAGSYPPCTTPGPATALARSVSGGAGGWARTGEGCGGAGGGGGVLPPLIVDGGAVPVVSGALLAFGAYFDPIDPDSGAAVDFRYQVNWSLPPFSTVSNPELYALMHLWVSGTGLDFSTVPVTAGDAIAGADGPFEQVVGKPLGPGGGIGEGWAYHFDGPGAPALYPAGPQTITARLVLTDSNRFRVITHTDLSTGLWHP